MILFIYLLSASVLLLISSIAIIESYFWLGALLFVVALALVVRARRRWPADQDYYVGRNFTQNRRR